jgi:DNA-binding response OmpR family regulator
MAPRRFEWCPRWRSRVTNGERLCAFCVTSRAVRQNRGVHRLLFIEDDADIRAALGLVLEDEGYEVIEAATGEEGIARYVADAPDLVLLDVRLPDVSGFEVCRRLRARSITPIIMVTAQTDTHDLVAGLEAGADDYVTKPVVAKELSARIRAALRRTTLHQIVGDEPLVRFGDVIVNRAAGTVTKRGEELALTKTEYRLMVEFADHPNMVLSRDQLLERVWGYDYLGDSRLVDAHIRRLRVKIEDKPEDPHLLLTVRGLGYRMNSN